MSYTKQNFVAGQTLLANQLNAMDDQIKSNEANCSTLESAMQETFVVSNLFDITAAQLGKRLISTGTISDTNGFVLSDYINVQRYVGKVLYFSESVNVVQVLNSSKEQLDSIVTSTSSIDLSSNRYETAAYIRVSCTMTVANRLTISDVSVLGLVKPFGYKTNYPIVNASVDDKISIWTANNNSNQFENVIAAATTVVFQNCNGYKVFDNVLDNPFAYKCISLKGETTDLRLTLPSAVNLIGVQVFELVFYVENVANIKSFQLSTLSSATTYTRSIRVANLTNGWNKIRLNTAHQETLTASAWSTATSFRFVVQGTGAFAVSFAALNLIRIDKAKLIFVDDHGYHDFLTLAYPLLKAAGQPTTWAINPGRLGMSISEHSSILTQSDIDALASDPYSEFSFHSWDATATENMTPDEVRDDIQKCVTYLKQNGICPAHLWRAAWVQNRANNWWVAQDMLEACASHDTTAGVSEWPFMDFYNIPRSSIHGRSSDDIDVFFERMRLTHCTYVMYTHGCVANQYAGNTLHATVAEITYLAEKIEASVSDGWLEPTTFSRLMTMKEHGMYTLSTT